MQTIFDGIQLGIVHVLPILVFGFLYHYGRRLDLSLDAQIAAAGVAFCGGLIWTGSFIVGLFLGLLTAAFIVLLLWLINEWARVPIEIGSLLLAIAVFKALELTVGESISLVGIQGRLHSGLHALRLHDFFPAMALLVIFVLVLELGIRTELGLLFRAIGDNPDLPVRLSRSKVLAIVTLFAAALVGVAGSIEADREGGVFSGFHLARVIDAFVVAEITRAFRTRCAALAVQNKSPVHRILIRCGYAPLAIQLFVVAIALAVISYSLVRFTHPTVPSLLEAIIAVVLLGRIPGFGSLHRERSPRLPDDSKKGLVVQGLRKTYKTQFRRIPVLMDVSFRLSGHGLFVLWGDNASGKSTLLRILAGLTPADTGYTIMNGANTTNCSRLLHQDPTHGIAESLSIRENLTLAYRRSKGAPQPFTLLNDDDLRRILQAFSTSAVLLADFDRPLASYSGGQVQTVAIACSIVDGSPLVLADEPTKMLDDEHTRLAETELTRIAKIAMVIMSSHVPRLDLAPPENHLLVFNGDVLVGYTAKPATQHVAIWQ